MAAAYPRSRAEGLGRPGGFVVAAAVGLSCASAAGAGAAPEHCLQRAQPGGILWPKTAFSIRHTKGTEGQRRVWKPGSGVTWQSWH